MKVALILSIFSIFLSSCAYPVIPASRIGHTPDEHAKLKADAESGDLDAQLTFGMSYCCGSEALYSNRLATKWICSAAKKEHPEAQFKIADLYRNKLISIPGYESAIKKLPENDKLALAWFMVADKSGHPKAKEGIEIFRRMAFEDVIAAIDLSRKYPEIPCEIQ